MSNYGLEYKEYYNNLKNKHNIKNTSNEPTNDLSYLYRGSNIYSNNNKIKDNFISSLITMQLVGTTMLFLFVFGTKYSGDENLVKYYSSFKTQIEEEYKNSSINSEMDYGLISDKINNSIKWLKDKIGQDNFGN